MYVVKLFVSIVYSVSERFTIAGRISQYCYDIISIQCTSDIRAPWAKDICPYIRLSLII